MSSSVPPARLTVQSREPIPRAVAAEIVQRAHAAGMLSATIYRGRATRLRAIDIPAPRSLSLPDEEGTTTARGTCGVQLDLLDGAPWSPCRCGCRDFGECRFEHVDAFD